MSLEILHVIAASSNFVRIMQYMRCSSLRATRQHSQSYSSVIISRMLYKTCLSVFLSILLIQSLQGEIQINLVDSQNHVDGWSHGCKLLEQQTNHVFIKQHRIRFRPSILSHIFLSKSVTSFKTDLID